jgi:hypothetical protein
VIAREEVSETPLPGWLPASRYRATIEERHLIASTIPSRFRFAGE